MPFIVGLVYHVLSLARCVSCKVRNQLEYGSRHLLWYSGATSVGMVVRSISHSGSRRADLS
jgi:hypothetical protein